MPKSVRWLMMTPYEQYQERGRVISMLEGLVLDFERLGMVDAAHTAYKKAERLKYINASQAVFIARREAQEKRKN